MFSAALFTMTNIWKPPKCPGIDKLMKKMWCIYHSHKKNELLSFKTVWMEIDGIMLSEINQRKTNTI